MVGDNGSAATAWAEFGDGASATTWSEFGDGASTTAWSEFGDGASATTTTWMVLLDVRHGERERRR